jgi:hypothetical protein
LRVERDGLFIGRDRAGEIVRLFEPLRVEVLLERQLALVRRLGSGLVVLSLGVLRGLRLLRRLPGRALLRPDRVREKERERQDERCQ